MASLHDNVTYVNHLCYACLVVAMLSRLFIAALWSPEGKGLVPWLFCVMFIMILFLSHWSPGTGVVLVCIDSRSLLSFLLWYSMFMRGSRKVCQKTFGFCFWVFLVFFLCVFLLN